MVWTETALRDYLLGQLPQETVDRIEEGLLEDDDLFAALRSAEDDLFDAYARGRLGDKERVRFLERYGHQAARLQFAQALANKTAVAPAFSSMFQRPWVPVAAAATLVLAAGALFSQLEAPGPGTVQPQSASAPSPASPPPFVVALSLGTSRAAGSTVAVTVPAGTTAVRLDVRPDPADKYASYSMELKGAGERTVWTRSGLPFSITADGTLVVPAEVPASALPAGSYELAVRGVNAGAPPIDLGFLPLTVRWSP